MTVDPIGELRLAALHESDGLVESAVAELEKRQAVVKIWERDPSLWKSEPEHQTIIRRSLGWLTVADLMSEHVEDLKGFAEDVRREGIPDVLLLGMGGSSLCPDVLRLTFGSAPEFPRLHVLDTTDPCSIRAAEQALDLGKTLFIVASKSGTTPEVSALHRYFFSKIREMKGADAGCWFVAITDPATPLEVLARAQSFRRIFVNPPDIGGRYSALSYFGLLPATLMGCDIVRLLDRAQRMARACVSRVRSPENPGLWLGAVMGALAGGGRDKVTLVCSPEIASFGWWVEQLIAESTGKDGLGIVPVEGEAIGTPTCYAGDRFFVYLRLDGTREAALDDKVRAIESLGHPVVTFRLQDLYGLGGEFFRWEFATAVAGALIGVNPFDQPNVQESKDNTRELIEEYRVTGSLPEEVPLFGSGPVKLYGDDATRSILKGKRSLGAALRAHLLRTRPGDYVAFTAYLPRTPATEQVLDTIRTWIRDRFRVATTLGYGPRFLHSTGQLHKGGGGNGLFIQFTADDPLDISIPGEPFSFGVMKRAQALGDLRSLERRGRRLLRVHIVGDLEAGLTQVRRAIMEA